MPEPQPQRYRFVVRSAEEAVAVLRAKLGPGARVVSVQQVESGGLARFLQSPKLEVIAEVPAEAPVEALPAPEPETPGVRVEFSTAATTTPFIAPPAPKIAEPEIDNGSPLTRLLRSAGLPRILISRLQTEASWLKWEAAPPSMALEAIGGWLRQEWRTRRPQALGQRIAFIGSAGAGKTTALCKQLATDVFCRQRRAIVLKLDLAHANPGDGLAVVCEAFGATFARDLEEVPELTAQDTLYVDVPGVSPHDPVQTAALAAALDPLHLSARVLVANAAYETALLKRTLAWGSDLGCAHAVFTHLDELSHWGKLWDFALHPRLTTISLGTGQNIAGDVEENVFDALLSRTLPAMDKTTSHPAIAAA